MNTIFTEVMNELAQLPELRFVGEDWGQLNLDQPPVNFPCALIDLGGVKYSNLGRNEQRAEAVLNITVADIRYDGITAFNPADVNNQAFEIFSILDKVNAVIHGYGNAIHCKFARQTVQKILREDSLREFLITFKFGFTDEITASELTPNPLPPHLTVTE